MMYYQTASTFMQKHNRIMASTALPLLLGWLGQAVDVEVRQRALDLEHRLDCICVFPVLPLEVFRLLLDLVYYLYAI